VARLKKKRKRARRKKERTRRTAMNPTVKEGPTT
jgi:hypothetical protein